LSPVGHRKAGAVGKPVAGAVPLSEAIVIGLQAMTVQTELDHGVLQVLLPVGFIAGHGGFDWSAKVPKGLNRGGLFTYPGLLVLGKSLHFHSDVFPWAARTILFRCQ